MKKYILRPVLLDFAERPKTLQIIELKSEF